MKAGIAVLLQQLADPTLKGIDPVLSGWLEAVIIGPSIVILPFLIRAVYLSVYKEGTA